MDIKQRLQRVLDAAQYTPGALPETDALIRDVLAEIERLQKDLAEEVRKLRDANAAISNLIADREPYDPNEM